MENENIVFVNPRNLRLMDCSNPTDFPFYDFLQSDAQTDEQIEETKYYKWYLAHIRKGSFRCRRTGEIKNEKDIMICLRDLLNLNEAVNKDPNYKNIPLIQVFLDSDGQLRVLDGCHRTICSIYYNDNHSKVILIPVSVIDFKLKEAGK